MPGPHHLAALLQNVPLFADLDEELCAAVATECAVVSVPAGDWLYRQGEVGAELHVVLSGRLEIVAEEPAPARVVNVIRGGDSLGELALLTGEPRAASVRALRDTELLTITRGRFQELFADPRFAVALTGSLARAMQAGARFRPPRSRRTVLTLQPMGDVPIDRLAEQFVDHLERTRRVARLRRPQSIDDPVTNGQLLDRLESEHDHVVLVARSPDDADDLGEWGRFCLRQADRVVVVIPSGTPAPSATSDERFRGADLVVVGDRPGANELADWFDVVGIRASHWVPAKEGFDRAVARLARRVTGQSIGLVMSGGGARGLAHIGVVQALEEAGLTIDRYGGTSMGSAVSAMFATGRDVETVTDVARRALVERNPFFDYTVPRFSLVRGRRSHAMLQQVFGSLCAEELPLDWYAVSAEMLSAGSTVHRRGPVADAVMASVSLPGIVPPHARNGGLLIDGGVLNNLPTDVMADADEGPVLAVDVMSQWGEQWREQNDPDQWQRSMWCRMGWPEPLPTIVETIMAASVIGSRQNTERQRARAALTIVPDLTDFSLFDFEKIDDLVRTGRDATHAALDADPEVVDRLRRWPMADAAAV
jgi:NTE family protein